MNNKIAIVCGEKKSIGPEIISKSWNKINLNLKRKIFLIGDYDLLKYQFKKIMPKIKLRLINNIDNLSNELDILHIKSNKKEYVRFCLNIAHTLSIEKKIKGFVNCPVEKKSLGSNNIGVTEYLSKKNKVFGKELMMIYNNKFAVVPLTTHIPLKMVTPKINKLFVYNKIFNLNYNFKKILKRKPRIAVLGLNPHNQEMIRSSKEITSIIPAIKKLRLKGVKVFGPYPADSFFTKRNINKFDIAVGMYHDQVLTPFKTIFGFEAINITLGLRYLRVSPDHGVAKNIIGKKMANPSSLILALKFLNKYSLVK